MKLLHDNREISPYVMYHLSQLIGGVAVPEFSMPKEIWTIQFRFLTRFTPTPKLYGHAGFTVVPRHYHDAVFTMTPSLP